MLSIQLRSYITCTKETLQITEVVEDRLGFDLDLEDRPADPYIKL